MTIQEILHKAYLKYKLSPLDAGILLSLAGNMPREFILAHPGRNLSATQTKKFYSFCTRRANGEPIAYITGKKEFFGLEFLVNKKILIPRPETEMLVEKTIENINSFFCHPGLDPGSSCKSKIVNFLDHRVRGDDKLAIVDIGTGSGNIIISIAKNIPKVFQKKINFFAIDVSKETLRIAKTNARKNNIEKEIRFVQSDMLGHFLKRKLKFKNILIVANLPYVSCDLYKKNYKNLKYEPEKALLSKKRGLDHYQKLFKQINNLLSEYFMFHVSCFVEFSPEQKPEIARILKGYWPKVEISFFKDLAGKWRMAKVEI